MVTSGSLEGYHGFTEGLPGFLRGVGEESVA